MTFQELNNHIIPMSEFRLKWSFTEEKYNCLPEQHLNELKPLDKIGAEFLSDYLDECKVHYQMPFKNGLGISNEILTSLSLFANLVLK